MSARPTAHPNVKPPIPRHSPRSSQRARWLGAAVLKPATKTDPRPLKNRRLKPRRKTAKIAVASTSIKDLLPHRTSKSPLMQYTIDRASRPFTRVEVRCVAKIPCSKTHFQKPETKGPRKKMTCENDAGIDLRCRHRSDRNLLQGIISATATPAPIDPIYRPV